MIHAIGDTGQRGNRLLFNAHCLATAISCGQDICFWTFGDFEDDYVCRCNKIKIRILRKPNIFIKMMQLLYKVGEKFGRYQNIERLRKKAQKGKDVYFYSFYGWGQRDLEKYRKDVVAFFEPQKKYKYNIDEEIKQLREKYQFIIGVHIRRGDYINWENGRYFFEFSEYKKWIKQTAELMKNKGKLVFLIFSNEDVPEDFCDENIPIFIKNGSALADQYFLSQCDYIISTRSTFASWAEYMGQAKRACMVDAGTDITESSFKTYF